MRSALLADVMSQEFTQLKAGDSLEQIARKLKSSHRYVVLTQPGVQLVKVHTVDAARRLFSQITTARQFFTALWKVSLRARVQPPKATVVLVPGQAYVARSGNALKGVYLQPLPRSQGGAGTAMPVGPRGGISTARPTASRRTAGTPRTRAFKRTEKATINPISGSARATPPEGSQNPFFLNAEYPEKVKLHEELTLSVYLARDQQGRASLPILVPDDPEATVDIVVQAASGFELLSTPTATLKVYGTKKQAQITFILKATELSAKGGKGEIRVYAFQGGQPCGSMVLSVEVTARSPSSEKKKRCEKALQKQSVSQPDLYMWIQEERVTADRINIKFFLKAADANLKIYLKPYGPVQLTQKPADYFHGLFTDIEGLNLTVFEDKQKAVSKLERLGAGLYEQLIPEDLKFQLWALKDKIKTIQIDSDEPWIPWEICRLSMEEDGDFKEAGFLCELFEVTRWIPGKGVPVAQFSLEKAALVVPSDSGLPYAAKEKKSLKSLMQGTCTVEEVPATYQDLETNLKSGTFSLWHFTGHGLYQEPGNPEKAALILSEEERFTPDYLTGSLRNMGKAKPLVFLNACQVGRAGMGLTGISGWAPQFLASGASAFIGTYWSVLDDAAFEFARAFYQALIKNKLPIGRAVLQARQAIKDKGDPTWLAYTVFADPFATVE